MFLFYRFPVTIQGYDFVLLERKKNNKVLNTLRSHFEKFIESKWGKDKIKTIRFLSYSLVFSMLPLHEESKRIKFYEMLIENIKESQDEELVRKI